MLLLVDTDLMTAQQIQYNFRHLTPNEGLSNETVNAISEDGYGYIWLGTSFGLNRFDGVKLKKYFHHAGDSSSLVQNIVQALLTDKKGRIWIGCQQGFCQYDYSQEKFVTYNTACSVTEIAEDKTGAVWAATVQGFKMVDTVTKKLVEINTGDTLLNTMLKQNIKDVFYHQDDRFYLATARGVLVVNRDMKNWQLISSTKNGAIGSDNVEAVTVDKENRLWVATDISFSTLYVVDSTRRSSKKYDYFREQYGKQVPNRIRKLLIDDKGRLWISSTDLGLSLFEPGSDGFKSYLYRPGQQGSIANNQCEALYFDRNGLLWIAVSGYGVDYFHPDRMLFSVIEKDYNNSKSLLNNWARAVAEDEQHNLWLATGRGVTVLDKKGLFVKNFENSDSKKPQLWSASVRSVLYDKKGNVWIGTSEGLNRYNIPSNSMKFYGAADSLPNFFIHFLYQLKDGRIVAGGNTGLFEYLPVEDKFYDYQKNPILKDCLTNVIKTFREDNRGFWWIGTFDKGVFVFDPVSSKIIRHIHEDENGSLSNNSVQSLLEDEKGNMWIGTRNGLNCYNMDSGKNVIYSTEQGLLNTWISGIQFDKKQRLWIGTGKGLYVMNASGKIDISFDITDGLVTTQFNEQNAFTLADGRFIFPSRKGFIVFNPDEFTWNQNVPVVYITSITVRGTEIPSVVHIEDMYSLTLEHYENFFTIELRGLNFLNPRQCWYAYKLEGFDKEWIYSNEPVAKYTNVPGGTYRFRYKASNTRYEWNVKEKEIIVVIKTVFYRTWWFTTGLLSVLFSGLYFFIRKRMASAKRMNDLQTKAQLLEKEKALVMYENLKQHLNPHFLFNSLTSLSSLIRIDQNQAGEFLDKMSKVYRYVLKNRDNETVPLSEELKFVNLYNQLQKTRFEEGLQISISIDEEFHHRKIAPVTLQNLVENAIKHNTAAPEQPLIIDIFIEDDFLVVRNNLQKKHFVETSNKQGLANMLSLYRYLGNKPMEIKEEEPYFIVKIPLL